MKKNLFLLTPILVVSLLFSCANQPSNPSVFYEVTFDSDGGTEIPSQKVKARSTATRPTNPTKTSEKIAYTFDDWYQVIDGRIQDKHFNFGTKIESDITLKAKWKEEFISYTVTFDSDTGELPSFKKVYAGRTVTPPLTPVKQDELYIYEFIGWYQVIDGTMQTEPFDFSTEIYSDINLKAKWGNETPRKYKAKAIDNLALKFFPANNSGFDDATVIAGKPFSFKMRIDNASTTDYIVPNILSIKVGNSEYDLLEGYWIDKSNDGLQATVTIDGQYVLGDITITGEPLPVEDEYYNIDIRCFGVISSWSKHGKTTADTVIEFNSEEHRPLPTNKNILLKIDDHEWQSADKSDAVICDQEDAVKTLTIKANSVSEKIVIITRSPQYQILEDITWRQISEYSIYGFAPYLFEIGDTKTVLLNGIEHHVRIIDFNKDVSTEHVSYFNITFEFVEILSDANGLIPMPWNDSDGAVSYNYNFIEESNVNREFARGEAGEPDGSIFEALPNDLKGVIRETVKSQKIFNTDSDEWENVDYRTRLFPLSYDEIYDTNLDDTYEYYVNASDEKRIKNSTPSTLQSFYWLRSPDESSAQKVYCISPFGDLQKSLCYINIGVSAAFCV